ncbi:HAD family hydrolase [Acidaminobacter sp. JC074]|uniref:HAD family hydrolase n=1 Tax=Acidaminobacter sp. JC074 TaxID=2530199 RepID=UPI001F1142D0|nr:HAD family hydrolase [Acidaminobacter sp. JC074]MCH4889268.1 HAD family hydrolase [Acidaminobacter sp. JC074]
MIKNIIFDIDGTLINTTHVNMKGLQSVLEKEKIYKTIEELTDYDGLPSSVTLSQLKIDNLTEVEKKWHDYVQDHKDEFTIYYAIPTILKLLSKDYKLSLVTSRNKKEVAYDKKLNHIMAYFDGLICYDDTKEHKPHPAPLLKAINQFDYKPEETIYIGDSIYDYQAATSAGIRFFKAAWGNKDFDLVAPNIHLKTPIDLLMYLN